MVECFYCGATMESDGEGGHVCRSAECAPPPYSVNDDPDLAPFGVDDFREDS